MKFDIRQAMRNLNIEVKPFGYTGDPQCPPPGRDSVRGYSTDRWLAINPREEWPTFVAFHEMAHILLGHTTLHHKFGAEKIVRGRPSPNAMRLMEYKEANHDLFEAECHATAIIAAQLTGTPFDLKRELQHLEECYTRGRKIPDHVMARARKTAQKIAAAGKLDQRSLDFGRVAA